MNLYIFANFHRCEDGSGKIHLLEIQTLLEATNPFISFTVSPGALSTLVLLKFSENIEEDTSLRDTS